MQVMHTKIVYHCMYMYECMSTVLICIFTALCLFRAHFRMMKNVPIVGWDVAFSNEGIFLLEVRTTYMIICL